MRMSDWSSDVCSSDLIDQNDDLGPQHARQRGGAFVMFQQFADHQFKVIFQRHAVADARFLVRFQPCADFQFRRAFVPGDRLMVVAPAVAMVAGMKSRDAIDQNRSEERTSELQSIMRISY